MITKKNQYLKLTGAVLACAVISACSSDNTGSSLNSGTASSGDADVSQFVSIGDSLTAGFADGALYLLGQTNSFPNILAQQFADADGVAVNFTQPLAATNFGGFLINGNPAFLLNRLVLNTETQSPERLAGAPTEDVLTSGLNGTAFNNMGVPGAKSFDLPAPGFGNPVGLPSAANPYFTRFAIDPATSSIVDDAAAQAPSFYTLWIGNNDVLGFATSGGDGTNPITPTGTFDVSYSAIVGAMTVANPAVQGVLINIPDVSTIPFFTTVPFNPVPLDQASADGLNAAFAAYNAGVQSFVGVAGLTQEEADARTIAFVAGEQNALLILDEGLIDLSVISPPATSPLINMRQATAEDLIVLPASAKIGELVDENDDPLDPASPRWGVSGPLTDADVLTATEVGLINVARTAFNATIKATADADDNLAFFDAAAVMAELQASGIDFGTGSVNSNFVTGGAFGLDGVHPTGRGYAVIANEIIDVINTEFNANVFKVDPTDFPTIFLK
ncbi:FIG00651036: hypothetical protein [hydrothermal vent metagenome]|uniref:G-D-S-L family lipolytic protein n=1 Tax=hydrothermal vent metagenome TaxID=652676 RepID=A0A3B0WWH3_9ZZZZ